MLPLQLPGGVEILVILLIGVVVVAPVVLAATLVYAVFLRDTEDEDRRTDAEASDGGPGE